MNTMETSKRLDCLIENLTEEGLKNLILFAELMMNDETFDKRTSPERLDEIQRDKELKEEQRRDEEKRQRDTAALDRSRAICARTKEKKENLPYNYKRLYKRLESVADTASHFTMSGDEVMLFNDIHEGILLNGIYDVFLYGFFKGQISEMKKQKELKEETNNKLIKSIA